MSTTVSEPLSLEDQCLLHLICHLEDYLPETLASLPLHLRHRLLLNLPAVDVCQLENTAVSADIDMEDTWKRLSEERTRARKHLVDYSCYLFLSGLQDSAKELLFSVERCLGVTNWQDTQHPLAIIRDAKGRFKCAVPHRHMQLFSGEYQAFYFLVEKYKWAPVQFEVNTGTVDAMRQWKKHEQEHNRCTTLLQSFLRRVQELELSSVPFDKRKKPGVQFILEQILINPQIALSKLKHAWMHLDVVAKFFSPAIDDDPIYSHPNVPYSGLSAIVIDCFRIHPELYPHLQSMVQYQSALTSVYLKAKHNFTSPSSIDSSVSLMSTLGSLFLQPQFKELRLHWFDLTWEHLGVLVPPFLAASSEDSPKVLDLYQVKFPESGTPPEPVAITTGGGVNRLPEKTLVLSPEVRNDVSHFLKWLSACDYTSLLSSISMGLDTRTQFQFPDRPTISLQRLSLGRVKLGPSSDKLFANIFQCPNLKTVLLGSCNIGPGGHLPALTQGLRRQVSLGILEILSLGMNELCASAESELQEFFDVVFSLPQLSHFQLDLSCNRLNRRHFSLMHDSWKRNTSKSGKRLKALKALAPNFKDSITELQDMAQSGDFL